MPIRLAASMAGREPPFVLALDAGTSSTRALLFDAHGRRVPGFGARAPHQLVTTPDGGAFLEPEALFQAASVCLEQVRGVPVAARAMDSFWHSLMGVDARGKPSTPVLTWADTRAMGAALELRELLDEPAVHARTGCRLHASYWPAKLRWLARAEPQTFRRTKRWLSFGEYFQWRLTGELACSISMASGTGLLDQHTCQWDRELLDACGIEPAQLAPLMDLDHRLPGDWLPAIGDGASSNVGSGCTTADRLAVNAGTSSAMRLLATSAAIAPPAGLWCYRLDRRRILLGGALSEGGNLLAWLRSTLRLPSPKAGEAELAAMQPDAHGLTVLPFISGERSTGWRAGARLTVSGIGLSTRPIDLLRASLEAIAYRLQAIHQQLEPFAPNADIVASGSAMLSSPTWLQILADVLNRPVHALADPQATIRGTALLALESLGLLQAGSPATYRQTYLPNPRHTAVYREAIERQQALYAGEAYLSRPASQPPGGSAFLG